MSQEKPAAFPGIEEFGGGYPGMELRDYFAAMAMHATMTAETSSMNHNSNPSSIAELAYEQADKMLEARRTK